MALSGWQADTEAEIDASAAGLAKSRTKRLVRPPVPYIAEDESPQHLHTSFMVRCLCPFLLKTVLARKAWRAHSASGAAWSGGAYLLPPGEQNVVNYEHLGGVSSSHLCSLCTTAACEV